MQELFSNFSGQIHGPYLALINFLRKLESQGGALRRQPVGECHERYLPVSSNLRGVSFLQSFGRKGARWRPKDIFHRSDILLYCRGFHAFQQLPTDPLWS